MKRFWQWLGTALLVAIFLSLANWQWNRADELKNPPKIDQTILPIDSLISPSQSITQEQVGRRVEVEGKFISNWVLPNQKVSVNNQDNNQDNKEKNLTSFDVGLFQTKDNAAILVLRGIHKDQIGDTTIDLMVKKKVIGYLLPQQSEDVANTSGDQITRIDSALFVTKTELPLYAPYIHAISESPTSGYQTIPFNNRSDVPGYYWQHISYVVIWFLFALTAIYLMVYQRRLDKVKP